MNALLSMTRALPWLVLVGALAGCGDHNSTQEAYELCQPVSDGSDNPSTPVFQDCVDCYETCGSECIKDDELGFVCPDELEEATDSEETTAS